jgi:flagellar hook protein FlgE
MITAFDTSLSGMRASQGMLDVTANNLANVQTNGFKRSRVDFADQISRMEAGGQQPRGSVGGVNADQVGLGVKTSAITNVMEQGPLNPTGRELDVAITGSGFFRLQGANGQEHYTRVGAFAFDAGVDGAAPALVDLATGYRVLNTQGAAITQVDSIPAQATTVSVLTGNLASTTARPLHGERVGGLFPIRRSDTQAAATTSTPLASTTLARSAPTGPTTVNLFGTEPDGTPFNSTLTLAPGATVGDLVDGLNAQLVGANGKFAAASISNGQIVLDAALPGGQLGMFLGEATPPATRDDATANAWQHTAGGTYDWNLTRFVPESTGGNLSLFAADGSAYAVPTRMFNAGIDAAGNRIWDQVAGKPVGGTVTSGVIRNYSFSTSGALVNDPQGSIAATWDVGGPTTVQVSAARLTGYAGDSVIDFSDTTGYATGRLQSTSVDATGTLIGSYSNGRVLAMSPDDHQIGMAVFTNPAGLQRSGDNLWDAGPNSGAANYVAPGDNGDNAITGGALEGANVDLASEYVRLILAQRSFESNSKAFSVADQLVQAANGLIR